MKPILLEQVFGVSKGQVLSYIEREHVDGQFLEALVSDRQIVVYGSSKQGKTALVDKHLPYKSNIVVSCSPRSDCIDIYQSILRQLNVEIETDTHKRMAYSVGADTSISAVAKLPLIVSGEAKGTLSGQYEDETAKDVRRIEFNLNLPQDVSEIIHKCDNKKYIILENFHYLTDDMQKRLAFDLRTFQEKGIRFVILGVWREKNRLMQFNGDLQDRIIEIPVEPWKKEEFEAVIKKGEEQLGIEFGADIILQIINNAFDSIGVVQELLKTICAIEGVSTRQANLKRITSAESLQKAVKQKASEYASRHVRALEDIAKGHVTMHIKEGEPIPLFLPYYMVRAFLNIDFSLIVNGIDRSHLESEIKKIHHRKDDVRPSDMSNLLNNLSKLQHDKDISPPIYDYDRGQRTIKVIDSTFYFFLRNTDKNQIADSLINPLGQLQ